MVLIVDAIPDQDCDVPQVSHAFPRPGFPLGEGGPDSLFQAWMSPCTSRDPSSRRHCSGMYSASCSTPSVQGTGKASPATNRYTSFRETAVSARPFPPFSPPREAAARRGGGKLTTGKEPPQQPVRQRVAQLLGPVDKIPQGPVGQVLHGHDGPAQHLERVGLDLDGLGEVEAAPYVLLTKGFPVSDSTMGWIYLARPGRWQSYPTESTRHGHGAAALGQVRENEPWKCPPPSASSAGPFG